MGEGRSVTVQAGSETTTMRGRFRVSLKVSLIVISLLTVFFTAAAVHLPWLFVSRDNVAVMAQQRRDVVLRAAVVALRRRRRLQGRYFRRTAALQRR